MSIQETIAALRGKAYAEGVTLSMAKLNDALAKALSGRSYSPLIAAEREGSAPKLTFDGERCIEVARQYGLEPIVMIALIASVTATKLTFEDPQEIRLDGKTEAPGGESGDGLTFDLDNLRGEDPTPLYKQYAGQHQAQPAFVELTEKGEVSADYSGEIGNAVPGIVWHGRTLRFTVDAQVDGTALADLLESDEGRGLLARIHAGHEVDWNGNNHVGKLTDDARDAKEQFKRLLEGLPNGEAMDPEDFFLSQGIEDIWEEGTTLAECASEAFSQSEWYVRGGEEAVYDAFKEAACNCIYAPRAGRQISRSQAAHLYEIRAIDLDNYLDWLEEHGEESDPPPSTLPTIALSIEDSDASTAEIERGVSAAMESLRVAGVTTTQAYIASRLDTQADNKAHPPHLEAWAAAETAALKACFEGWARWPDGASLTIA